MNSPRYTHDALGNTTQAGLSTPIYSFDAENRLVKVSTGSYCYVYDGNGVRVAKKSGANSDCSGGTIVKLYWRGLSGDTLAETDATGSTTNSAYVEYVFFAGRRIAARGGSGAIFYYFADQLGTTRTITTGNGPGQTPGQLCRGSGFVLANPDLENDADYTPYGQEMQHTERLQTAACPPNYRFTGYEFDSETGLYYAFARYYSPLLGRFLSTDPLGGSVGNLQSHNAYSYTSNNPMSFVDPSGLGPCPNDQSWSAQLCKQAYALGGMSHFDTWDVFSLLFKTVCGEAGCVGSVNANGLGLLALLNTPTGTKPCTINVVSDANLTDVMKDELNRIYGSTNVQFTFNADLPAQVQVQMFAPIPGYGNDPNGGNLVQLNYTSIGLRGQQLAQGNVQAGSVKAQNAAGVVLAHEIGHYLTQLIHYPDGQTGPNDAGHFGLMAPGYEQGDSAFAVELGTSRQLFTAVQIGKIRAKCRTLNAH